MMPYLVVKIKINVPEFLVDEISLRSKGSKRYCDSRESPAQSLSSLFLQSLHIVR